MSDSEMVGGGADAAKVGPAGNSAFEELERGDSGSLAADAGESNVSIKSGYERGAPNGLKADGAGDLASDSGDKVPDGGLWAWMVVLACGLCNFICFGVQQSFGIFIGYYLNVTFAGRATAAQVSLTSSLQGGFSFILGPLVGRVTDRFGPRITCMIGVTLQVISNLAASFCVESIGGLWATQGILFGIGTCFVSNASLSAPPMYFRKRLSLAFGLATTLGGLGGLCFTFGTQAMLVSLGPAWALRIYAIFIAALLYPSAMVFKSRGAVAASPASNVRRPFFNFKLFADFRFLTMFLAIVLCCMSFPGPFFLPAYAYDAGLPASVGTNLLALMTAMSALSTLIAGALVSKTGVMNSFVATQLIAALSYFAFWMPAGDNLGMLYAFSAVYGIVWGSFWSNLAASVAILFSHLDVFPVVIGTAYFGASLAFFANAPVFGALVDLGKADGKGYRYAQAWAGGIYLAGVFCLAIVRFWTAGWKLRAKV